jgi:hypothetical protein
MPHLLLLLPLMLLALLLLLLQEEEKETPADVLKKLVEANTLVLTKGL